MDLNDMSVPVITERRHYNPDSNKEFISREYLKRYTDPTSRSQFIVLDNA